MNINMKIIPNIKIAKRGLAQIQAHAIKNKNEIKAKIKAKKTRIVAPIAPKKGIIPINKIKGYNIR